MFYRSKPLICLSNRLRSVTGLNLNTKIIKIEFKKKIILTGLKLDDGSSCTHI